MTAKSIMKFTEETDSNDAATDDKPAIEEVFEQEESALLRYAYGFVKRREVAEEVVQEAFMKLHQLWDEVLRPKSWLYKAVRNIALNQIRKSKRETLSDEVGDDAGDENVMPDNQLNRLEAVSAMRLLMADLGKKDRELVKMKFEDEMSYSVISEKLEMGVGNVGYRLHHVLKGLAEGLKRKGIDGI